MHSGRIVRAQTARMNPATISSRSLMFALMVRLLALQAQIKPETFSNKTLGDTKASWFIAKATMDTSFVFDATHG